MSRLLPLLILLSPLSAQEKVVVEPTSIEIPVGETAQLEAHFLNADGERDDDVELMFLSRSRLSVTVTGDGLVTGIKPGTFTITARTRSRRPATGEGQEGRSLLGERVKADVRVTILPPALAELSVTAPTLYAGTTVQLAASATDVNGELREETVFRFESLNEEIATIDAGGLALHAPGTVDIVTHARGLSNKLTCNVLPNPVVSLDVEGDLTQARTGDVVHFTATAKNAAGEAENDVPVFLSFYASQNDTYGPGASGQIEQDGRFVAETPGTYTVVATCGSLSARASVAVVARDVGQKIKLIGRGKVHDMHTSDLWVWEGVDGRDYCVTGTWGANGDAIFWDVTDPENIERIATVTVDARTVNDVKVSPDGTLCILSREGASNRKNGVVLVDVRNPREPKVLEEYTDALTGGVHNLFIDGDEVYALSAGRRYDVLDLNDGSGVKKLSEYELDSPGHSIHDVWIENGLAYSSNWSDGVHIVDVGNGIRDGSPENPQFVASHTYPSGWNHAAFPFRSEDTGRFYVVAGDEAFPYGLSTTGNPTYPRGWLHFIDFTDLENPDEVARYQVPEAGTHNLWIEGNLCYVAYYNAGLRVLDISGELMGDLYRQGREIAWFLPTDPEGYIPNAPMVWGPQPYKGHIFFSDWNTGLWCVKLMDEEGR